MGRNNGADSSTVFSKLVIAGPELADKDCAELARENLRSAGYPDPVICSTLGELDETLKAANAGEIDLLITTLVWAVTLEELGHTLYDPKQAAELKYGKRRPGALPLGPRTRNAIVRCAAYGDESPGVDPIVKVLQIGGCYANGHTKPAGPAIYFQAEAYAIPGKRFVKRRRGGKGKMISVRVKREKIRRRLKRMARWCVPAAWMRVVYDNIPFKALWAGDRSKVVELGQDGRPRVVAGKRLEQRLEDTAPVVDFAKIARAMEVIPPIKPGYSVPNIQANSWPTYRPLVFRVDDTPAQLTDVATGDLENWCRLQDFGSVCSFLDALVKGKAVPTAALLDGYMPGNVVKGRLNCDPALGATEEALGFALGWVCMSYGVPVALCTDAQHHHNDVLMSLLGTYSTMVTGLGIGYGFFLVFEATMFNVSGYGYRKEDGKLVKVQPLDAVDEADFESYEYPLKASKRSCVRLLDPESGKHLTTVYSANVRPIKDWTRVFLKLLETQSPPDNRRVFEDMGK